MAPGGRAGNRSITEESYCSRQRDSGDGSKGFCNHCGSRLEYSCTRRVPEKNSVLRSLRLPPDSNGASSPTRRTYPRTRQPTATATNSATRTDTRKCGRKGYEPNVVSGAGASSRTVQRLPVPRAGPDALCQLRGLRPSELSRHRDVLGPPLLRSMHPWGYRGIREVPGCSTAGGVAPNSDRAGPELEAPCH